jgi:hypothetical protein
MEGILLNQPSPSRIKSEELSKPAKTTLNKVLHQNRLDEYFLCSG